jgi:hypothetical protein
MQPGIGTDLGNKAKILTGFRVAGKQLIKLVARVIEALVAKLHSFILGADTNLTSGPPDIVGVPLTSQALNLLRHYRFSCAIVFPGDTLPFSDIIRGICDINLAVAAENSAPSL